MSKATMTIILARWVMSAFLVVEEAQKRGGPKF